MVFITLGFGVVLAILGLVYYLPDRPSITALIPTFFGVAFIALGLAALKSAWRKHAMHAASALGLLGVLFPAGVVVWKIMPSVNRTVVESTLMAVVCLIFTSICVRSFIAARRAREQKG